MTSIKVIINGTELEFRSAREAAEVIKELSQSTAFSAVSAARLQAIPQPEVHSAVAAARMYPSLALASATWKLAEFLVSAEDSQIPSEMLAKALGVKSEEGIGPSLRYHREQFRGVGIDLDAILKRTGSRSWTVSGSPEFSKVKALRRAP